MRIVGHGIDLVECARIEQVWRAHPERFLSRILTEAERRYCTTMKDPVPRVAGRWAAKEAVLKALGTGWRGPIAWTDIEIGNDGLGQPMVRLSGACAEIAARRGITRWLVSITHTRGHAAASAIGMGEE